MDKFDKALPPNLSLSEENIKKAKLIHEKARYMRGRMLNSVAVIENHTAIIITRYFCQNQNLKRNLFYELIIEKLSLEKKANILKKIVETDYLEFKDNFKHLTKIKQIIPFRNILAHSTLDFSEEILSRPIDEGISFSNWNESKPITEKDFEDWQVKASDIISDLKTFMELLPK